MKKSVIISELQTFYKNLQTDHVYRMSDLIPRIHQLTVPTRLVLLQYVYKEDIKYKYIIDFKTLISSLIDSIKTDAVTSDIVVRDRNIIYYLIVFNTIEYCAEKDSILPVTLDYVGGFFHDKHVIQAISNIISNPSNRVYAVREYGVYMNGTLEFMLKMLIDGCARYDVIINVFKTELNSIYEKHGIKAKL